MSMVEAGSTGGTRLDSQQSSGAVELSVVVPTYNERANVAPLVAALDKALKGHAFEVIFVDDNSPDGTSNAAKALAQQDRRVRCLRRVGRRGLSTAVIEGILSSSAPFVAVMDGDLQHDERLLPRMLEALEADEADIAIASRYVEGGDAGGLADKTRHLKSQLGNWLVNNVLRVKVSDPMSGFFMLRRERFDQVAGELSGVGFKILLDILTAHIEPLRVKELPMTFRSRLAGDSKLDFGVELAFVSMVIDKSIGRYIPRRFLLFSLIGGSGVFVHLGILKGALLWGLPFAWSQLTAAVTAMTTNFLLNNHITFADRKLKGTQLILGLLSFYAVCSVGLLGNVGVAEFLFANKSTWWLSGLAGAVVGAVWNYAVSSIVTWRRRDR
jgi:dolichol-phosphate mannosyltransferase